MFNSVSILCQLQWHAPQLWPLASICAAVLLAALVAFYPGQLGQVRWPWRGILPMLRLIAILALVISFLKPVAMRLASADERGAVVFLVDRSLSMGIVDNARSKPQLVALADAMGKLPPKVRSDAATRLSAGIDHLATAAAEVRGAQEDLDYARISGRDIPSRQKHLQETAANYVRNVGGLLEQARSLPGAVEVVRRLSMLATPPDVASRDAWRSTVPEQIAAAAKSITEFQDTSDSALYASNPEVSKACDAVAAISRFSLVEQALLRPDGIAARVGKDATVTGFSFADDLKSITLINGDKVASTLGTKVDGDTSDLTGAIKSAVSGRTVRAVVLFSDGRQVGGDSTIVSGLSPNSIPVFAVGAAAPETPRDISFATVSAPSSAFAGQWIRVKAELRHSGFDGKSVDVHFQVGSEAVQTRKITLHDNKPAHVEFSSRMAKGVQDLHVWFDKVDGEACAANDGVFRKVKVTPDPLKVLFVAGAPTWDFQYARSALSRLQETVRLKDIVLDPNNPHLYLPPREIRGQDVIVLFDVPVAALDKERWDAVKSVVEVAGGSVILVAGDAHLPTTEYSRNTQTLTLLPFLPGFDPVWQVWPGDDPSFHFVPAADAESLELFRLPSEVSASDPEASVRRWDQLPGFFRYLRLPQVNDKSWRHEARALMIEEESRVPVLTEMRLEKWAGRAFFLGLNETWRWRFKAGERDQEYFWRQLVQYASEAPYFDHDGPLALDTDKIAAAPGEAIHVRARISEETPAAKPYLLQVLSGDKVISEQPLLPIDPALGVRFGCSLALPAGEYKIRWTVAGDGPKPHKVEMPIWIQATSEKELADLSGDTRMLRKLAESSGGEFLTLDQVNRLPERIAAAGDTRSRRAELSLWDSPYLFLIVVGCFGVEWALRKRLGLA